MTTPDRITTIIVNNILPDYTDKNDKSSTLPWREYNSVWQYDIKATVHINGTIRWHVQQSADDGWMANHTLKKFFLHGLSSH